MKKTIRIENTLPHLLEAIWNHPDCPDWLQNVIWDGVNDRCERTEMTATYWASQLESARPDDPSEQHRKFGDYLPEDDERRSFSVIQGGVQ